MNAPVRRRKFVTLLGTSAVAWPLIARGQQPAMPVIGFLHDQSPVGLAGPLAAFREGLKQLGFVEGQNVAIEYRWADGQNDRLPALVAELVRRRVAVIAAPGSLPAALAAKAVTTTIPIFFSIAADPVQIGLVASFNRPGGNVTGISSMNTAVACRWMRVANAGSKSFAVPAFTTKSCRPSVRAAACTSAILAWEPAPVGLSSMATRVALGLAIPTALLVRADAVIE